MIAAAVGADGASVAGRGADRVGPGGRGQGPVGPVGHASLWPFVLRMRGESERNDSDVSRRRAVLATDDVPSNSSAPRKARSLAQHRTRVIASLSRDLLRFDIGDRIASPCE